MRVWIDELPLDDKVKQKVNSRYFRCMELFHKPLGVHVDYEGVFVNINDSARKDIVVKKINDFVNSGKFDFYFDMVSASKDFPFKVFKVSKSYYDLNIVDYEGSDISDVPLEGVFDFFDSKGVKFSIDLSQFNSCSSDEKLSILSSLSKIAISLNVPVCNRDIWRSIIAKEGFDFVDLSLLVPFGFCEKSISLSFDDFKVAAINGLKDKLVDFASHTEGIFELISTRVFSESDIVSRKDIMSKSLISYFLKRNLNFLIDFVDDKFALFEDEIKELLEWVSLINKDYFRSILYKTSTERLKSVFRYLPDAYKGYVSRRVLSC